MICLGNVDGDEIWLQCDVALDDLGGIDYFEKPIYSYANFCVPYSAYASGEFKHTPKDEIVDILCSAETNEYNDTCDWMFATRYNAFGTDELSEGNVADFIDTALDSQLDEYLYFLITDEAAAALVTEALELKASDAVKSPAGWEIIYKSHKYDDKLTELSVCISRSEIVYHEEVGRWEKRLIKEDLDPIILAKDDDGTTVLEIEPKPGECKKFMYTNWATPELRVGINYSGVDGPFHDALTFEVDDPDVLKMETVTDRFAILRPMVDGTANVTVSTVLSPELKRTFTIKVGTGVKGDIPDYIIWAGGKKESKSITLTTDKTATNWTDSKGKEKAGKLVWVAMKARTELSFDAAKHTLSTKSDAKTIASVSNKGVVSAKGPGFVYVYAVDTGSMTAKEYVIEVKQSAAKIEIKDIENKAVKKIVVEAASSGTLVLVPSAKSGAVSENCTYSVSLAKEADADKLSVGDVYNEDGKLMFKYNGLKSNGNKAASVKVNVVNDQSGKKGGVTIQVTNPVKSFNPDLIDSGKISKKGDELTVALRISAANGSDVTTDKLKVFVCTGEPTVSGTKITYTASKEIKASLSKDGKTVTLKASKDLTTDCGVYLACTDPATKTVKLLYVNGIPAPAKAE